MHLARVWLSVFKGNIPAERLYRRSGFEESGSMPGYLQEGLREREFYDSEIGRVSLDHNRICDQGSQKIRLTPFRKTPLFGT